ncbi:MAG: sigma-70 family RNA polymerase sigma factor [Ilumatobacteraceae bacterium]
MSIVISEVFREHRTFVHSIASRYCNEQAAADVTQDVFVRFWNHPERFDENRGSIRQYLATLTRGVAIDYLRRESARRIREERTHDSSDAEDHDDSRNSARLITNETTARVTAALALLGDDEREAIVAAFYNDVSYRQVGVMLGVAEGTIKSRIRLGLKKLRVDLVDQDEASTPQFA